jgi:superfamily II RNA helicase
MHQKQIKQTEKTPHEDKIKSFVSKRIEITDSKNVFNETNYHKMCAIKNYIDINQLHISRKYVLNDIVKHLYDNSLLPAICFVLSRKNVEVYANEIEMNLFDPNECAPPIEYECKNILYSKFDTKTAQDIMLLPEFISIINLLKKGIAIHHAGIMPILREMVELLFEKNYIRLLFATETFAVGINMPTKTVIFTGMTKFNGSSMRNLYSHEYKQMAGRAGRRGIDTIGYVIHCNNLFNSPTSADYKTIMTGPPQMLSSKFKISFNLILNILQSCSSSMGFNQLGEFVNKSMITQELEKELNHINKDIETIEQQIAKKKEIYNQISQTPIDIVSEYIERQNSIPYLKNKVKIKTQRDICQMEEQYKYIERDSKLIRELNDLSKQHNLFKKELESSNSYINSTILTIVNILSTNGFIKCIDIIREDDANNIDVHNSITEYSVSVSGVIASCIQEAHPLALSELYTSTSGFNSFTPAEIAALFSCFTILTVRDELKKQKPSSKKSVELNRTCDVLYNLYVKYDDLEARAKINTGCDYNLHFQIMDEIIDWCNASNEIECMQVIGRIKGENHEIFLGEFIKAILKINNIASEFEKICEQIGNVELLHKISKIPQLTLKYVVTNMSLYI